MRRFVLTTVFGVALGVVSSQAAEVVVKIAPPRMVVEKRGERPSERHVWVSGYHLWEGGRWDIPPREHAVWVAPRWQHRHDGYVFVEGRWR